MPGPNLYLDGVSVKALVTKARTLTTQKTKPKPQTTQKQFDVTLKDLEEGRGQDIFIADNAQDVGISPPAQPQLFTLDQDRTLTYRELKELPDQKPAYYDPKTQTAYTGLGVFLAGMGSLVGKDIDPRKMDPLAKAEYYAGRATAEVGLAYGLGEVGGALIARSGKAVRMLERLASFGERHAMLSTAVRGTVKGLVFGGEAAKGIKMKMEGYGWDDVIGELGGDFASLYAFDRGFTGGFEKTRKAIVRKAFAEKKSRFFAGEMKRPTLITKNDPEQIIMTRTPFEKNQQIPMKFKPSRTGAPAKTKEMNLLWLPDEAPNKNTLVTGTINTKARPRTTFKLEAANDADDVLDISKLINRAKQAKVANVADETKFLEQEKGLPEQLYTSDEKLLEGLFKKEKTKASKISSSGEAKGKQETVQLTKSTLKKVSIGRTRTNEIARVTQNKRELARIMRKVEDFSRKLFVPKPPIWAPKSPSSVKNPILVPIPPSSKKNSGINWRTTIRNVRKGSFKNPTKEPRLEDSIENSGLDWHSKINQRDDWHYDFEQGITSESKFRTSTEPKTDSSFDIGQDMKTFEGMRFEPMEATKEVQHTIEVPKEIPLPLSKLRFPRRRTPRVRPKKKSEIAFPNMALGQALGENEWIGWGRKNNVALFTIKPIKIPNPFASKPRGRKGGRKRGIL